jgi:hypothetical protein
MDGVAVSSLGSRIVGVSRFGEFMLRTKRVRSKRTSFEYPTPSPLASSPRERSRSSGLRSAAGVALASIPRWGLRGVIGLQNRSLVVTRWAFNFATRGAAARLITGVGFDRFARPGEVPLVESS